MKKLFNKHNIIAIVMIMVGLSLFLYPWLFEMPKALDLNYQNLQKIKKTDTNGSNFSFVVFGDNKNSVFSFPKLIKMVNKENIAFSIETGDLIDNMIDGNAEYKIYLKQINALKKPFLVVLGNHETEGMSSAYYYLFGRAYYAFGFKNSYFLMLDGSHETGMGDAEFAWLKQKLEIAKNYRHTFVFMHIPLHDPVKDSIVKSQFDEPFATKLQNLFDKYKIDMIFTAHQHGYFTGKWGKTPYTVTGGAGAELGGEDKSHFFHHYVLVNLNGSKVDYKVKQITKPSGSLIDEFLHNLKEFISMYALVHWDLFLVILGLLYLFVYNCIITRREVA
ncbi:MAG: metallophosphoesterase [Sulfurospirillum sp.]